jgi:hypothetical protein
MKRNPNAKERRLIENEIFELRQKIDKHLRAGDTGEVQRLQRAISHLQQASGVVKGRGKGEHDDRIA